MTERARVDWDEIYDADEQVVYTRAIWTVANGTRIFGGWMRSEDAALQSLARKVAEHAGCALTLRDLIDESPETFQCASCKRHVSVDRGANDSDPEMCDACANYVHRAAQHEPQPRLSLVVPPEALAAWKEAVGRKGLATGASLTVTSRPNVAYSTGPSSAPRLSHQRHRRPSQPTELTPLSLPNIERDATSRPVLIVGGEEHNEKLYRIRKCTTIGIEWIRAEDGPRVALRVRGGHIQGVVLLNGLANHSYMQAIMDATRQCGVPVEYANKGGISMIFAALQALDRRIGGAS